MTLRESLKSTFIAAGMSSLAGMVMLMQEMVIAANFSTSGAANAYQLAISFPLLAVNVFAGGTLLAVMVPSLTQYVISGRNAEVTWLIKRARRVLGWGLFLLCAAWALAYPHVVTLVAKGFPAETQALSVHLLWLLVLALFFSGLAGVDAAILNSRRRLIFNSMMPAFMPAGVIVCVLLLESRLGIYAAGLGLLCGSALQWLASRRLAAPLLPPLDHAGAPPLMPRQLIRDYASAAASSALLAGILLTDTFMAASQPAGSAAVYGYAVRPVILLLAFVTAVVGNVVLSFFAHLVANGAWLALKRQALFWFGLLGMGSLPVVILWYKYAPEIVALLFQRGAFGAADTARVAAVQQVYLLQIPFFLVAVIGWRVMNSLERHTSLLYIATACFFFNLVADMWLVPRLGLSGIAWGTDMAFALWAILIVLYLWGMFNNRAILATHEEPARRCVL